MNQEIETNAGTQAAATTAHDEIKALRQKVREGLSVGVSDALIDAMAWCVTRFGEDSCAITTPEAAEPDGELTIDEFGLLTGLRILDEAQEISADGKWLFVSFTEVDRDYLFTRTWIEEMLNDLPGQYERISTCEDVDVDSINNTHVVRKGNAVAVITTSGGDYSDDDYDANVSVMLTLAENEEHACRLALAHSDMAARGIARELGDAVRMFASGAPRANLLNVLREMLDELQREHDEAATVAEEGA